MDTRADESARKRRQAKQEADLSPSPLDPFLRQLLDWATDQHQGFGLTAGITQMVATAGWQPAFADAVVTSARVRRLIEPYHGRGSRGRSLWHVSKRGRSWLTSTTETTANTAANH